MNDPSRHLAPPPGYSLRAPTSDDAEAVAALKRAVDLDRYGDSDVTVDEVREEWALPRLSMSDDLWLVEDRSGSVIGYGLCWIEVPPREVVADQIVAPGHRGHGLSGLLLELAEERARELLRAGSTDATGGLGVWSYERDTRRLGLLAARGFAHRRTFLRLERRLDESLEVPVWPAGVTVARFRPGADDAAVHAAHVEAFPDDLEPEEMELEGWLRTRSAHQDTDLTLWFIAWDGDELVGGIEATETPGGGYMGELFVRRPWRGRGIGRALLLQECAELRRRGAARASFAVDTANPTGALRLFDSVGFASTRGATLFFEKRLGAG
jgi:ribosomal protein S18 acetylase RimI-like enzyme